MGTAGMGAERFPGEPLLQTASLPIATLLGMPANGLY